MNEVRPRERVLALAQAGGIVRARDVTDAGIARTYLQRLCREGRLVRVARGLYQAADADITAHHSLVHARAVGQCAGESAGRTGKPDYADPERTAGSDGRHGAATGSVFRNDATAMAEPPANLGVAPGGD